MRPGRRHARTQGPPQAQGLIPAPVSGIAPTSQLYPYQRAEDAAEIVEAFHVSGGRPYFRQAGEFPNLGGNEAEAGVQLIANVYVPIGYVGFVKGVMAAPYLGSYFQFGAANQILDAVQGVWQTPMGWEVFASIADDGSIVRPSWKWYMRVLNGTLSDASEGTTPATTGFLVPNVPLPTSPAYGGVANLRLPGKAAGKRWSENRMQRYGWTVADDQVHVLVPEDKTILVFAVWTQTPQVISVEGEPVITYVLGPSFGALVGSMQKNARPEGQIAAREGWRG